MSDTFIIVACPQCHAKNRIPRDKMGQQAKNYTSEELRVCQRRLLETHEQLVSGSVSQELILEMLVIKLIAKVGVSQKILR